MARSRERNEQLREERRRRILSTAARLFATRGFAATKIADIAAAEGMSHGLLYHYYGSKEEIFVAIVRDAFDKLCAAALELERLPQSPRDKLALAASRLLADLETGEEFAWRSALISLASVSDAIPDEARAIIREKRDVPYRVVAGIVKNGQAEGTVRDGRPEELALLFWTAVKGLALHKAALGAAYRSPSAKVLTNIFFEEAPND